MEMIRRSFKEEHIQFERECWRRTLDFISLECVHCKNHLASLVSHSDGEDRILNLSENYLSRLLQTEASIRWLRQVIANVDRPAVASTGEAVPPMTNKGAIHAQLLRVQQDFYDTRAALFSHLSESR